MTRFQLPTRRKAWSRFEPTRPEALHHEKHEPYEIIRFVWFVFFVVYSVTRRSDATLS